MICAGFDHVPSSSHARVIVGSIAMVWVAAGLGFAGALSLIPTPAGAQGTPEQREACTPDAMRLCSDFIPDVERITACMAKNRLRLSPACRIYFVAPKKKGKSKKTTD
jgi:hypothetical protein